MMSRFAVGFALVSVALLLLAPGSRAQDAEGKAFRFSVMGDNRPRSMEDLITPPAEFLQAIREVNLIRPDLSLILGDMIMGYTGDEDLVQRRWDAFDQAVERFEVPVKLVVGNHDVWDAMSLRIYEERYGALYYSFSHEGCRFIVLNSEDLEHRERIDGAQLEWLKGELEKGGRRIFLFVHKPFWRYEEGQSNWMEVVHPLLAAAGVDAVFAGHWHHYERSTDHDAVRYYITGGAGAEIGECEHMGDFFHHLVVDVPADDEEPIEVRVLKTGFLQPDTIVREDEREACYRLAKALYPAGIETDEDQDADVSVGIRVTNPWEVPVVVHHEIDSEESGGWRMEPAASDVVLPPGEEAEILLRFRCEKDRLLPGPALRITATRGKTVVVKDVGRVPVRFRRRLAIAAAEGEITIDGKLDEAAWKTAATAGRFLSTDGASWAAHETTFRICRDDEAVYLAFRCEQEGADRLEGRIAERDWRNLSEDCLIFYLDPVRDGKSRFCFGTTAAGVPSDYRAPGGVVDTAWNPEWKRAVTRDAEGWTFEVRIPFAILGIVPEPGMEIGLNVIRLATAGERQYSGWFIPMRGVLFDPKGFGTAVLK